jgi:hypothetical protein
LCIRSKSKPASIVPLDGRLKQAVINSKQQSFKNLKLKDQIARPAEVQPDISKELPPPPEPTAKEFIPSPELSSFFNADNQARDHFHPLNQFMRPPTKEAARFPFESEEQKWNHHNIHPNDVAPNFLQQHGMMRNTHVEFPHQHADRQINFFSQHFPSHDTYHPRHNNHHQHHQHQFFGGSSERMIFPTETSPFSDEFKSNWQSKLNDNKKGTWKWIPDNNEQEVESPEAKFNAFHSGPAIYDSPRPHTVRDRPYSFESGDVFNQHTTPPTGPASGGGFPWPTAEALMTGEEMATTGKSDESERGHLDVKLLR